MTAHGRVERRAEGCTVVLCTASACRSELHAPLMSALRAAVRSSTHGMLVTTGCRLGPLACHTREHGPLLMVQPCDQHRQPIGCAVLVGPLRSEPDVAAVEAWLRGGRYDLALLPGHLRTTHRAAHAAVRN
ncbi:hypothetical protein [Pseudonocardia charpentierae]|uniref:(2Fe-2S) ferredoxin n=1 Tax=Pseudonocardia charpentierae TaxID=3075545 RepID=A0ABU2NJH5_9PSEU|nr:hypothetical protein [Pseudonocardia sp. DSM 45834]MDT0353896.1 hypothetical protein [Pseudonocardia sp. DSM 45834]